MTSVNCFRTIQLCFSQHKTLHKAGFLDVVLIERSRIKNASHDFEVPCAVDH